MSNLETARTAYDAFASGDLATLQEGFDENAVWVTSDELPLGGTVRGRDQIMGNFAQIPNYWQEFSVRPEEFIEADDDYVIVRGTQHAANDKGSMDAPFVHVLKYEDGKVVRGEFFTDSAKAAKLLA